MNGGAGELLTFNTWKQIALISISSSAFLKPSRMSKQEPVKGILKIRKGKGVKILCVQATRTSAKANHHPHGVGGNKAAEIRDHKFTILAVLNELNFLDNVFPVVLL